MPHFLLFFNSELIIVWKTSTKEDLFSRQSFHLLIDLYVCLFTSKITHETPGQITKDMMWLRKNP